MGLIKDVQRALVMPFLKREGAGAVASLLVDGARGCFDTGRMPVLLEAENRSLIDGLDGRS